MADQTIWGLPAPESSLTGSMKIAVATGANSPDVGATLNEIANTGRAKTFTTKTTSDALTGAELINTIILLNPPDGSQTYTLNSAALIYAAMGSPPLNTSREGRLVNITGFNANLTKIDGNLDISGMPSVTVGPEQTFDLEFTVTQITPAVQVRVSGGQSLNTDNPIPNLIFASPDGSASEAGNGSYQRPYTAAYAETKAVIGQSTILYTPGTHTGAIALKPSIERTGFGNQVSVLSGAITIDQTEWDATVNPHLDMEDLGLTGTVNLVGGSSIRYDGSALRAKNCVFPTGASIDVIDHIQILNDTQATNLTISNPSRVLIQSKLITGSLTFNEGFVSAGVPIIYLDGLGIDTLNGNLSFGVLGLPPFKITNCPNLGTGTLDFHDLTEAGNPWDITVDAISYPTTIVPHSGTNFTIARFQNVATGAVDQSITGAMLAPDTISAITVTAYTLVLGDYGKFHICANVAAQTITIPTNASVAFPVGTSLEFAQLGAGQVDFVGAVGVTIQSTVGATPKISAQFGKVTFFKTGVNTWLASDDIIA